MVDFFANVSQEVSTGRLDLSTALVRIEQRLSQNASSSAATYGPAMNRDFVQEVHTALPMLVKNLFLGGWDLTSSSSSSATSSTPSSYSAHNVRAELTSWLAFLRPQGALFAFLVSTSRDIGWSYELPAHFLPPSLGASSARLNMVEYFWFWLWKCSTTNAYVEGRSLRFVQDEVSQASSPRNHPIKTFARFRWPSDGWADAYIALLTQHLQAVLPESAVIPSPSLAKLDTSAALDMMLHVLFGPHHHAYSQADPQHACSDMQCPNVDHLRAMRVCLRHLATFQQDACELGVASKVQRLPAVDVRGQAVCQRALLMAYRALRVIVPSCSSDASLAVVVLVWQAWMALASNNCAVPGLLVLGGQLLAKHADAIGAFAECLDEPVVDVSALESQLVVLTGSLLQILSPMASHLDTLHDVEEGSFDAKRQFGAVEVDSFRLRPLFLVTPFEEHPAVRLWASFERLRSRSDAFSGNVAYNVSSCTGLLQRCFPFASSAANVLISGTAPSTDTIHSGSADSVPATTELASVMSESRESAASHQTQSSHASSQADNHSHASSCGNAKTASRSSAGSSRLDAKRAVLAEASGLSLATASYAYSPSALLWSVLMAGLVTAFLKNAYKFVYE